MSYLTVGNTEKLARTPRLAEVRRLLPDIGIYLATHAKKGEHFQLGMDAARLLGLYSLQTQELLAIMSTAESFGVDEALRTEVEQSISESPIVHKLKRLLRQRKHGTNYVNDVRLHRPR